MRARPDPSERRARLALAAMVSLACCVGVGVVSAAVQSVRTSFPAEQGKPFKAPRQLVSRDGVLRARLVADETAVRVGGRRVVGRAYNGSFPGPTLRLSPGDTLRLTLVNRLSGPTNMHFHGMHVSPAGRSDNVLRTVASGTTAQYVVSVPLDAAPGTYWYHPHWHDAPVGNVEPQVMGGLSGTLIVGGLKRRLPGPLWNIVERNLVLKDVQLTTRDRIVFRNIDSAAPTTRTVNGRVNPVIRIGPGETQLWRLGNQSADIWYRLKLDGSRFHVVAEDGNPVGRVWSANTLTLPPAKRYDVLVQGHGGGDYHLRTLKMSTGPVGDNYPARVLATVRPNRPALERTALPTSLGPLPGLEHMAVDRRRTLVFSENTKTNRFFIDGRQFDPDRVDQRVKLGAVEEWTIRNISRERHPFHIHVNDFQVISVNGRPYDARSLADTFPLPVGGEVVIRMHFTDFTGEYVYHCHILAHEDRGMMGTVKVEGPTGAAPGHHAAETAPSRSENVRRSPPTRSAARPPGRRERRATDFP
jgi:suppressor of ftsI